MTTKHEERKRRADEKAQPGYFFSYVLRKDDGTFYVGSTNAPFARWTEHAVGVGAQATAGRRFTVCMALPFLSRKEAEYNEKRMQAALDRGPLHLEDLIAVFNQMAAVVRPPKTLEELEEESRARRLENERSFHFVHMSVHGHEAACGGAGARYGSDADRVVENDHIYNQILKATGLEGAARRGAPMGRKSCAACLPIAQAALAERLGTPDEHG